MKTYKQKYAKYKTKYLADIINTKTCEYMSISDFGKKVSCYNDTTENKSVQGDCNQISIVKKNQNGKDETHIYKKHHELSKGSFGSIWLYRDIACNPGGCINEIVVKIPNVPGGTNQDINILKIFNEIKEFNCKIIPGIIINDKAILMTKANGTLGNIFDNINIKGNNEQKIIQVIHIITDIMRKIADMISCLREHEYGHADLKKINILMRCEEQKINNGNDLKYELYLGDYGGILKYGETMNEVTYISHIFIHNINAETLYNDDIITGVNASFKNVFDIIKTEYGIINSLHTKFTEYDSVFLIGLLYYDLIYTQLKNYKIYDFESSTSSSLNFVALSHADNITKIALNKIELNAFLQGLVNHCKQIYTYIGIDLMPFISPYVDYENNVALDQKYLYTFIDRTTYDFPKRYNLEECIKTINEHNKIYTMLYNNLDKENFTTEITIT